MRTYLKFTFPVKDPEQAEILAAYLINFHFEAIEEKTGLICAYADKSVFPNDRFEEFYHSLELFRMIPFEIMEVEDRNWNKIWESNFKPVIISNVCAVRAPFHKALGMELELIIEPKMAFGTGHNATMEMMMELMLKDKWYHQVLLDVGSGTGILAILADKLGAEKIIANELDEAAVLNCFENVLLNKADRVQIIAGNISKIQHDNFDSVLMNINKNSILQNAKKIARMIKKSGRLYISGILKTDEDQIRMVFNSLGFEVENRLLKENWIALRLTKS